MGKYSIKELERLSGIKAHTIRIWEKRYQLIVPSRSKTNIRSYSDGQLKKLLNVSSLINLGYKISKISEMSDADVLGILEENEKKSDVRSSQELTMYRLIEPSISFDEVALDKQIQQIIAQTNLQDAFSEFFFPLLNRIGFLWRANKVSPAHEHFLSNKLMGLLHSAMPASQSVTSSENYLLFLPEWEEHEILLLFCNYVLRTNGIATVYLGRRVPIANLNETIADIKPSKLITIITTPNYEKDIKKYLKAISHLENSPQVIAGGSQNYSQVLKDFSTMSWVNSTQELLSHIY
ncbi:transcriptional regulator, MerR family [Reichenbachiella agariperforans]|uniref:Transcriptional regulator, MerR family n=1 Tax=Reichenbachiella agariperforans TaxID=156994 RepID=A0A1M6K8W3_REIAG|nr:MerR family transcriptional regulator [Reichenbachiella agariperforans]SHJ55389.1 transcriptional regulator, MerR family [Reichenbachiella agariperforans]